MTGRVLAVLAIVAPWLAILPMPDALLSVACYAITLAAAFHGYGLAVARLAKRKEAGAFLAIQWGIAATIAIAGLAIALGIYSARVQWFVAFYGAAIHSGVLAWRLRVAAERVAVHVTWERLQFWLVPAILIAGVAIIHVLGAAGDRAAYPFDDDGNLFGQIKRLLDTGSLGDAVGYPRHAQLGGAVALDALAAIAGDVRFAPMMDALGLVLFLGLATSRIRARDMPSAIWAALVVLVVASTTVVQIDAAPLWIPIGLVVALYSTIEDADDDQRTAIPAAIVAGALIALRVEFAPVAIVGLLAAWWACGGVGRTFLILAAIVAACVLPYWISRSHPDLAVLAEPARALWPRLLAFLAITIFAALLLLLPFGDDRTRAQRAIAWATAAGIAGIATQLTGERPYALRFLWPIAIAYITKLVVELARRDRKNLTGATSLVVALAACFAIYHGSRTPGRYRWDRRYAELLDGVEYLRHVDDTEPAGGSYDCLLAAAPPDATIAAWVGRPEQLDYTRTIIDLRTPRIDKLRVHRFAPHDSKLDALVADLHADYLLVEADNAGLARSRANLVYRLTCSGPQPPLACTDDLERIAATHRIVARDGNVALVQLSSAARSRP